MREVAKRSGSKCTKLPLDRVRSNRETQRQTPPPWVETASLLPRAHGWSAVTFVTPASRPTPSHARAWVAPESGEIPHFEKRNPLARARMGGAVRLVNLTSCLPNPLARARMGGAQDLAGVRNLTPPRTRAHGWRVAVMTGRSLAPPAPARAWVELVREWFTRSHHWPAAPIFRTLHE